MTYIEGVILFGASLFYAYRMAEGVKSQANALAARVVELESRINTLEGRIHAIDRSDKR